MYHINSKTDKPDIGYMEAVIANLMKRGIRLADCIKLRDYYSNLRSELSTEIQTKYGIVNPNSAKQISDFLEETSMKVDVTSRNDIINICYDDEKCKWTTAADALEKLSGLGYEFAQDILDYRHAKKYAESIESILAAVDSNGLIHPTVSLSKTNRIQYSKPGLLTIPKQLLWHVIAPYTPGNVLYSVDIKNQEPSILINMTGANELKYALESEEGLYETLFKQCFIPTTTANILVDTLPENRVYSMDELKQIGTISPASYSPIKPMVRDTYFNDERVIAIETICAGSEKGIHAELPKTVDIETANGNVYSVDVEWESDEKKYKKNNDYELVGTLKGIEIRVGKAERKEFKTAWNAISYGQSAFGVKMACKTIDGKQTYNYITKIAELKKYRDQIDKLARQGCTRIGTIFGTPLDAGYQEDAKKLKRVLLDLPVQGSGADILSLLIRHFYEYTKEHNIADKMEIYYTRHDELIIEVNGDWLNEVGSDEVEKILRDMLEHQINDWTPFKIEVVQTHAEQLGIRFNED
jgi:hypothetical protein